MSAIQIGVECKFTVDGHLSVTRVYLEGRWLAVEQGRQWVDQLGRHALLMLPGRIVREIRLRPDTMTWELLAEKEQDTYLV
jgi:hypothetical protein